MRNFMGNPCGFGNCMSTECKKCSHYQPTFLGMRIPKKLGNILYKIQNIINRSVSSGSF